MHAHVCLPVCFSCEFTSPSCIKLKPYVDGQHEIPKNRSGTHFLGLMYMNMYVDRLDVNLMGRALVQWEGSHCLTHEIASSCYIHIKKGQFTNPNCGIDVDQPNFWAKEAPCGTH